MSSNGKIGDEGIKGLQLPANVKSLDLSSCNIGDIKSLQMPNSLQTLDLYANHIGFEGIKSLQLPPNLQELFLDHNQIGDEGIKALQLPTSLQSLRLGNNKLTYEGITTLQLPSMLQMLDLSYNKIGDQGAKELKLPKSLQFLDLSYNEIGDEGVRVLLKQMIQANLSTILLRGNKFNETLFNGDRILQQQILLRRCRDKLCHANTPLQFTEELQTSSASRTATPFFSWLNKPMRLLAERVNVYFSAIGKSLDSGFTEVLKSIRTSLQETLSDCPSYFPNINSPVFHDHHPPGPLSMTQSQHLPLCVLQQGKMPIAQALPHQLYLRA